MRLEVATQNAAAHALYHAAGYREIERIDNYYEDGAAAVRMEKPLRGDDAPTDPPDYYAQTTEFTCGAACLMMALRAGEGGVSFDAVTEVRLWREATTVFMTSGLGGCEPYGMASVLAEQGVPVHVGFLTISDLTEMLQEGATAILLISGNRMFGKKVPHWVFAWAADVAHVFIHDPWIDEKGFETAADAVSIPVPLAELNRMWFWGAERLGAEVIAWPAENQRSRA